MLQNKPHGFTFVEVMVVLLIIGVISAVVISRADFTTARLEGAAEALKTHLRYTQMRSINTDFVWYIQFDATSSAYSLFKEGAAAQIPGDNEPVIRFPTGTTGDCDNCIISFDNRGRPCIDAGAVTAIPAAGLYIRISDGTNERRIDITPETGFIP
ncbi:MAG: type II secretion system protein [Desulfobacteraceae bacterium]|nr:type II secretion system protein [Desulfobacteraceae bacterium]